MSADLSGRLRCFGLSDILQLLGFSGQSGTLTLIQGWNSRTITFEKGGLTYIASATRLASVGELLVRAGRIDADRLRQAIAQTADDPQSLGPTLVELGWITPQDLKHCIDQQLEETIYSLFLWRNCQFAFDSTVLVKSDGLSIDLTTERIIIDGTRRVDEWIAISPYVPSVRMTYKLVDPHNAPDEVADDQDQAVLEHIDGRRDVVALAKACGLTQFETACSLARLCQASLVTPAPPDRVRIIQLFNFLVESIYVKLTMFGYARVAADFELELNRFAVDNGLKVYARGGKIVRSGLDTQIETTALIDLYQLFITLQQNRFAQMFELEIVNGLVEGLHLHVEPELQELLQMYEVYHIEGLLALG